MRVPLLVRLGQALFTMGGWAGNDGCLLLTPGVGCKGEGDSVTTTTPSDNCMTNDRFQSMYALWTVLSFNLLLVGDFAK